MRTIFILATVLVFAGCSANRGSKLIDVPGQTSSPLAAEAYPTKMGVARGPVIGSDTLAAGQPSGRRTTVRR